MRPRGVRGNLGETRLVRVKDMLTSAGFMKSPVVHKLNPGERTSQKGIHAMEKMTAGFFAGMGFTDKDKVIIVQLSPGDVSEMGHAVLSTILSASSPFLAYMGDLRQEGR